MSASPYQPVARLVEEVWNRKCSFKSLAYKNGKLTLSPKTFALVTNVLAHQSVIRQILDQVSIDNVKNEALLYVLVYELLLGPKKSIKGGGAVKRKILEHREELERALETVDSSTMIAVDFPRYLRVNTLKTTLTEVIERCKTKGIECYLDQHVPDLLVIHRKSTKDIQEDSWLADRVILQDKSSCFSALCLVHGYDSKLSGNVLDACAAPGNKTSHVAMLLDSGTTVYALDRSSKRLDLLNARMKECIPKQSSVQVVAQNQDFLKLQSLPDGVNAILLDPSCSGSGIYTAVDRQDEEMSEERVETLSNFQVTMLQHAMSLPVHRIVYSTCSIHQQENENVVAQAISKNRDSWKIVAPKCLSHWKRRGQPFEGLSPEETAALIRVERDDDTNGFFVCCFERIGTKAKGKNKIPKIEELNGVLLYAGQFAGKKASPPRPHKETPVKKTTVAATTSKEIPRKAQKKLAWKAKQRQSKLNRLKK